MTYQFEREPISGIILVYVWLNEDYKMKMVFDTGASYTTFDINALHFVGYPLGKITETGMVETANGKIEVGICSVEKIEAFGHVVREVPVQLYDYLKHGIISDYDGVLGLDFLEKTKFEIDMIEQTIEIKSKTRGPA